MANTIYVSDTLKSESISFVEWEKKWEKKWYRKTQKPIMQTLAIVKMTGLKIAKKKQTRNENTKWKSNTAQISIQFEKKKRKPTDWLVAAERIETA